MTEAYFFDTYAILEIIAGNPNYRKYTNAEILLTRLNLFELFYSILKEKGAEEAKVYLDKYKDFAVDFDTEIIESAGLLKKSNPKLSMTDSIGCTIAAKEGVKFLTGDKEFENIPSVEFVR